MLRWLPQKNKEYLGVLKASHWRRLSMGSWIRPNDPTIYAAIELNIEPALQYIEKIKSQTGERITITHFIGRVWGLLLKMHPELNSELRWGRFYLRKEISIAFQVAIDTPKHDSHSEAHASQKYLHGADLSAGMVRNIDQKTLSEVAAILNQSAHRIRTEDDPEYQSIKKSTRPLPGIILPSLVSILKFTLNHLNIWSPLLGVPKDSFGSIMITNVGSLGIDWAFPALFPPANNPGIIAIGAIYREPVYETGPDQVVTQIKLERFIRMCGAFDHRYVDGLHASRIARDMRKIFAHPEMFQV